MNRNLTSLSIGTIASSFAGSIFWIILPLYMWDLGFTLFDMGIIYAVQSAIMVMFSRFFGILADRTGRKKFIVMGNTIIVIAYFLVFLYMTKYKTLTFEIILLFSAIVGLGWAVGSGAFAAAITTVLSRACTEKATGVYLSADAIGWTIGSFVSGILIDTFGIIPVLGISLIASILALIVIIIGYDELIANSKYHWREAFRQAWSFSIKGDKNLVLVFILAIFLSLGASIYFLVFIIKFYIILGSKSLYGIISGIAGIFGIVAPYLTGKFGENHIKEILLVALTIRVVFMVYLSFSWDLVISVIFWLVPLWGIINVGVIAQTTKFSWEGYESEAHAIRGLLMQISMTIGNVAGAILVDIFNASENIQNMWIILIIGAIIYSLSIPITLVIRDK